MKLEQHLNDVIEHLDRIDYLGPATTETRAEVKSARRTEIRAWRKGITAAVATVLGFGLAVAIGTVLGNSLDADVRDIDIHLPSPSGERAEPEESAR